MQTLALELKKIPTWVKDTALVIGASILIALSAHFAIPFKPVPLVLQGSLILVLSVLLGKKRAPAAVALFLAQGAAGLAVFPPGLLGLARFVGPTGGYLLGYLIASYVVGKVLEMLGQRTLTKAFLAMVAGNAIIFLFGAAWLSSFVGGVKQALLLGVIPFILIDLLKLTLGLKVLQWIGWVKR